MSLSLTIARRELRGGLRGFRVFLACLALGVAAIAAVGTLRTGIQQGLADQGAVILGGDFHVASFTMAYSLAALQSIGVKPAISDRITNGQSFIRSLPGYVAPKAAKPLFTTLAANCIAQQQASLFEPDPGEFALA